MRAPSRPAAFAVSLLTHGLVLAWVASGPVREKPKSLYAQTIAPHSSKLVWYNFREKLPDVSPAGAHKSTKLPRAEFKSPRRIVAGSAKAPHARQFIWQPAPKLELPADLRSPNVLAMHVPRPEPPPAPHPQPKLFVPPRDKPKPAVQTPALAPPPMIHTARVLAGVGNPLGMHPEKAPPRKFVAPRVVRPAAKPAPVLPDAPLVSTTHPALAAPDALRRKTERAPPRAFTPPPQVARHNSPSAPLPDAPAMPQSASPAAVSMAIVGLNPNANAPAPVPEGARNAQFSAGPQIREKGDREAPVPGAMLTVPGLLVESGVSDPKPMLMARAAPTSAANLRAALHGGSPPVSIVAPHSTAVRVASSPDPLWSGRDTYALSVQMPNITSYSGSWMIWFSERRPDAGGGELNPPVPVRKVDPKYYPAAMADRIEGKVRLAAIIRKNGRVDSVRLLQHLDDRLDQSAQDALDKWQFEPALRNGQPVDVDAVFEIPFRLAPKVAR